MPQIDKPKISVSGSAANNCGSGAFKKSFDVGYQIAKQGGVLVTGATIGIPEWATRGAKAGKGFSIGLSPGGSKREHVKKYHLPTHNMDIIIYTGSGYSGRNLQMVKAADAVIEICGRVGTLNEFTIAFEDHKPVGILLGTGGVSQEIPNLLKVARRGKKRVFYDTDPARLVRRLMKVIKEDNKMIEQAEKKNYHKKVNNDNEE